MKKGRKERGKKNECRKEGRKVERKKEERKEDGKKASRKKSYLWWKGNSYENRETSKTFVPTQTLFSIHIQ